MSTHAQLPSLGEMVEGAVVFAGGFVAVFLPVGVVAFGALAALAIVAVPIVAAVLVLAALAALVTVPVLLGRAVVRGARRVLRRAAVPSPTIAGAHR